MILEAGPRKKSLASGDRPLLESKKLILEAGPRKGFVPLSESKKRIPKAGSRKKSLANGVVLF